MKIAVGIKIKFTKKKIIKSTIIVHNKLKSQRKKSKNKCLELGRD